MQPDLSRGPETLDEPDSAAHPYPVRVDGAVALAVDRGPRTEQTAADLRFAQPDC